MVQSSKRLHHPPQEVETPSKRSRCTGSAGRRDGNPDPGSKHSGNEETSPPSAGRKENILKEALESLFGDVTAELERRDRLLRASQSRVSTRGGGVTIPTIRRKLERGDYASSEEIIVDIDNLLKSIASLEKDDPEVQEVVEEMKKHVHRKAKELEKYGLAERYTDSFPLVRGAIMPSTQAETRDLNNLLYFVEKDNPDSICHILKANRSLARMLKKTSFSGHKFCWTALHMAAYYGKTESAVALLRYGANVEDQDTWHSSRALGWAASSGHAELCKLLIEKYNADENAVNANGCTAFNLVPNKQAPEWENVFSAAKTGQTPVNHNTPQEKVDSSSQGADPPPSVEHKPQDESKTPIKIFLRTDKSNENVPQRRSPTTISQNSRLPELQPPQAPAPQEIQTIAQAPRPSIKIRLGSTTPAQTPQRPLRKVIIKVPGLQQMKPSEQPLPESPTPQERTSKIILRPRKKSSSQKSKPPETPPQEPPEPSPSVKETPLSGPRQAQTLPFTAVNPLKDCGLSLGETISHPASAISSRKFADTLRALKRTLVVSIGIVSDRNTVRMILPISGPDLWSGISLNFDSKVRSLSIRFLMTDFDMLRSLIKKADLGFDIGNTRPSYTVSATQITKHSQIAARHNGQLYSYIRLKALPLVSNGPYAHDCCVVLEHGLNTLEFTVAATIPENFDVVTQKIELFLMRT